MSIEAMKNALELAKKLDRDLSVETWELAKVMGQLEQAIAETEQQEPEAWMHVRGDFKFPSRFLVEQNDVDAGWTGYALYTTPQPRKQLTDEQIDAYLESEWTGYSSYYDCFKEIVRWAEAKHDIKE